MNGCPGFNTRLMWTGAAALLLGTALLAVPLFRDFHFESAALASLLAIFHAAWYAARVSDSSASDVRGVAMAALPVYLLGLPLLVATLTGECFSLDGLYYWLVYPSTGLLLGYSLGRYFRLNRFRRPFLWAAGFLLAVAVVVPVVEFYTLPQLVFYNHVWGGWPGPLFDEQVSFTSTELLFRMITASWGVLLWLMPGFWYTHAHKAGVALLLGVLLFSYGRLAQWGIVAPETWIQGQLGSHHQTEHFDLYYDRGQYRDWEVDLLAARHEFHLREINDTLQVPMPGGDGRIKSYLYAHSWQKQEMVGAGRTNYVPVWLATPQFHVDRGAVEHVLRHELTHVSAREFGDRLINASWSIGLVEGVAVAMSPVTQRGITADQAVAAQHQWPGADQLSRLFSMTGFYGGRGAQNYAIAGSFTGWLLRNRPVEHFRQAYRTSDLQGAYPDELADMVDRWHAHLDTVALDPREAQTGRRLFAQPSLFEKPCPRTIEPHERAFSTYRRHLAERDTSSALQALDRALSLRSGDERYLIEWADLQLALGQPERVAARLEAQDILAPGLVIRLADAHMMQGRSQQAREYADLVPATGQLDRPVPEHWRASWREDEDRWRRYLVARYRPHRADSGAVERMDTEIRWLWRDNLLQRGERERLLADLQRGDAPGWQNGYLNTVLRASAHLRMNGNRQLAEELLDVIPYGDLRPAERHRIDEYRRFLAADVWP